MADNKNTNQGQQNSNQQNQKTSIGNQQATTQTGAQNNGGETIHQHNDQYTKDLRESGDRSSSGNEGGR